MSTLDLGMVRCVKLVADRRIHRVLPLQIEDGEVKILTACGIRLYGLVDRHLPSALPTCKACKETTNE